MCVLSIKVPVRKKSGNLFNDPLTFLLRTVSFIFFLSTSIMAMRQYSANIPPPEKTSLVGNIANNSQTFKLNFFNYSIASRLSKEANTEYQTSVFLAMIGQGVFNIYLTIKRIKLTWRFFSWVKHMRHLNRINFTYGNKNQQKILKHT